MEVILGCGPSGGNFENVNDIEFSCPSLYYSFQYCASIYDAIMLWYATWGEVVLYCNKSWAHSSLTVQKFSIFCAEYLSFFGIFYIRWNILHYVEYSAWVRIFCKQAEYSVKCGIFGIIPLWRNIQYNFLTEYSASDRIRKILFRCNTKLHSSQL